MESRDAADARRALGERVRAEREVKGLSIRQAARLAGIDRATWTAVEEATRTSLQHKKAPMEQVLGWARGSFEAILAGDDPTPIQMAKPPPNARQKALRRLYEQYERDHGPEKAILMWRKDVAEMEADASRERPAG